MFQSWIDFLRTVLITIITLVWLFVIGYAPSAWRENTARAAYAVVVVVVLSLVLGISYDRYLTG